ncbi:hypothetical protein HDU76_002062 [Blyttiomyces sp. JEL0837]|nr:hypothetical protein HDU76_002062 [Blyttiomyces sp. JEL0837]
MALQSRTTGRWRSTSMVFGNGNCGSDGNEGKYCDVSGRSGGTGVGSVTLDSVKFVASEGFTGGLEIVGARADLGTFVAVCVDGPCYEYFWVKQTSRRR